MDKTRVKVYISVAIVLLAGVAAVLAGNGISSYSDDQSSGIIIDFADRDVEWTGVNYDTYVDPISALTYACDYQDFTLTITDDKVTEINGVENDTTGTWNLWVIEVGSTSWTEVYDHSIKMSDYTLVSWSFRDDSGTPTVGLDKVGNSIYGYPQAYRIVTIAPSVTETVSSVGASNAIVGTDMYSNYPDVIAEGQESGLITLVGGYTNPSYEMVVKCDPDMVICYGGQQSHIELAEKLKKAGIDAIVFYEGEDMETLYDNIFIAGMVLGYEMGAESTLESIQGAVGQIESILGSDPSMSDESVMVSLSAVKSPWVSGSNTYIDDILNITYGANIYSGEYGWVQVNSETVAQYNPFVIIIVNSDYSATQSEYDTLIDNLSAEWKSTDAYKNGQIYLFCETLGDLASRPSPRLAQLTELVARTLHGGSFDDGISIPKYIGDDYEQYLTITKDLDFNK